MIGSCTEKFNGNPFPCTSDVECSGLLNPITGEPQPLPQGATEGDNLVEFCNGPATEPRPQSSCADWSGEGACKWDSSTSMCVPDQSYGTCDMTQPFPSTANFKCTETGSGPACLAVMPPHGVTLASCQTSCLDYRCASWFPSQEEAQAACDTPYCRNNAACQSGTVKEYCHESLTSPAASCSWRKWACSCGQPNP